MSGWRRLADELGPRPWPPPVLTPTGHALAATLDRVLAEYRDDAAAGLRPPDRWLAVLENPSLARELQAVPWPSGLLVSSASELGALGAAVREAAPLAIVRLAPAGPPQSWSGLLPPGVTAEALHEAVHVRAVRTRLSWPGLGTLELLHAWSGPADTPSLLESVSGVLRIAPESR